MIKALFVFFFSKDDKNVDFLRIFKNKNVSFWKYLSWTLLQQQECVLKIIFFKGPLILLSFFFIFQGFLGPATGISEFL